MLTQSVPSRMSQNWFYSKVVSKCFGAALFGTVCVYALDFILVMMFVSVFGLSVESNPPPILERISGWVLLVLGLSLTATISAAIATLFVIPASIKEAVVYGVASMTSKWGAYFGSIFLSVLFGGHRGVPNPDGFAEFGLLVLIPILAGLTGGFLAFRSASYFKISDGCRESTTVSEAEGTPRAD